MPSGVAITPEELATAFRVYMETGVFAKAARAIGKDASATARALRRHPSKPERASVYARELDAVMSEAARLQRVALARLRPMLSDADAKVAQGAVAGVVVVELPGLRLVNPLNNRQGWRAVSGRGKREKAATHAALMGRRAPPGPWVVTITRVSPGRLDDDGATASAKHVRDAVATWLGVDDADHRVRFVVTQAKGAAAVRIAVGPPRADVVRLAITRDQAGEIVRGLLDRDGGRARVECGGVVVELTVREVR